jgi:hypothetical protein
MAWIGVATEMPNFTDGRPSFTGYLTLQCVVAGLALWGGLECVRPALFARCGPRAPYAAAALCLALPLTAGSSLYVPAAAPAVWKTARRHRRAFAVTADI